VTWAAIGGGGLLLALIGFLALRRRASAATASDLQLLTPGASVAQLEAALAREAAALPSSGGMARPALIDPAAGLRDRARELASQDPTRAPPIRKAWMAQEQRQTQRSPDA
jgi:flagellar M-ring protein FliF